jgi:outer membrane protein
MLNTRPAVVATFLLGAALLAPVASAEAPWERTDWIVRGGVSQVDPKSGDFSLSPTATLGVDDDTGFSFDVTAMLSQNWGLELFAAPAQNHRTTSDSATASTPFGKVEPLIQTLTGQYHFNPLGRARPYVGAGLGYAQFSGEQPASISLGRSWGPTAVAGIDLGVTQRFFVNLSARWVDMDAKVKQNGRSIGDVALDPMIYSVNLGYRFGATAAPAVVAVAAIAPAVVPKPVAPLDSDGDGRVSPAEWHQKESHRSAQALFRRLDRNGDGHVDAAEFAVQTGSARRAEIDAIFHTLDRNLDSSLEWNEIAG